MSEEKRRLFTDTERSVARISDNGTLTAIHSGSVLDKSARFAWQGNMAESDIVAHAQDIVEWHEFKVAGYDCLVTDNPEMGIWLCYVRIPEGHALHGVSYDDDQVLSMECHGGVTFAGEKLGDDGGWWLGIDMGHYMDYSKYNVEGHKWNIAEVYFETVNFAQEIAARA